MPPDGGMMPPPGGVPGASSADITYSGAVEISSAAAESGRRYSSKKTDQSALLISTDSAVSIENPTVTKSGSSNGGDSCNFYGLNAAVLVKGGSTTTITGGTIKSSASGANGVFSYGGNGGRNGAAGDGTTVVISGTSITTSGSGSGGIMTTGGGVMKAKNLMKAARTQAVVWALPPSIPPQTLPCLMQRWCQSFPKVSASKERIPSR